MSPALSIAVRQLGLPLRVRGRVSCSFGETGDDWPGPHHCASCAAWVDEAVQCMVAARERGEFDAQGFRPSERRARRRRVDA